MLAAMTQSQPPEVPSAASVAAVATYSDEQTELDLYAFWQDTTDYRPGA